MADVMSVTSGQFLLTHTTSNSGDYTALLSTENTFVDKNIGVKITTPTAQGFTLKANDINSALIMGTADTPADPATPPQYSPTVSINGKVTVGTAGWIAAGDTGFTSADTSVAIGKVNQSLLKINNNIVNSGYGVTAGTSEITVDITEGYNSARTIKINPISSGVSASATVTATAQANTPTIARTSTTVTSATNVGTASATTSAPTSGYFVSIQATAPATDLQVSTTITTAGYLHEVSQIVTSAYTTQKVGSIYYLPITAGAATSNFTNNNISDYFTNGTTADFNISITPNYSITTSGYLSEVSNNSGTTTYYKIKTTSISSSNTTVTSSGGIYTATRGKLTWNTGWISSGTISAATFANTATSGISYVDISSTSDAPILTNGVLYINKGYVDNISITLGKLIPDTITNKTYAPAEYIRSGYAAYGADGQVIAGTMQDVTPTVDATVSTSTYFTVQGTSTGASFSITPSYTNTNAGYLIQHTSSVDGDTKYYKIKTAVISSDGGSGDVTLNTDTTQENSIYRNGAEQYIGVSSSAPAVNTNFVYIKVTGSGQPVVTTNGWITSTSTIPSGSSVKYIKIAKYTGSYTEA